MEFVNCTRLSRREHQRQYEEKSDRSNKTGWALSLGLVGAGFAFSTQALLAEEAKTRKVEKVEEKRKGKSQVVKLVFLKIVELVVTLLLLFSPCCLVAGRQDPTACHR